MCKCGWLLLLAVLPLWSYAHDLGVYARTWAIEEVNLKTVIADQAQALDQEKIILSLKSQVQHLDQHLTLNFLPAASRTATRYINPAVALKRDIKIKDKVIYQKGTWVNPLRWVRPRQNMLFFDGRDNDQLAFALKALRQFPYRLMLVMTAGEPVKLSGKLHRPVYYASRALLKRFEIKAVPSLLGVGDNKHQYELMVLTLASPYQIETLQSCWHGCAEKEES